MLKLFHRHSYILMFFIIFALLFSLGLFAWIKLDTKEQKLRLEALNRQLEALNMENEEVDYLLNEADEAQLYERLARERGYVYADEKVYYDVTLIKWGIVFPCLFIFQQRVGYENYYCRVRKSRHLDR